MRWCAGCATGWWAIDPEHGYIVTVRGHGLRLDNPEKLNNENWRRISAA